MKKLEKQTGNFKKLSTSIYNLVLIYVCHFHHHFLKLPLVKFDHYQDTRASILDPCIQGILKQEGNPFCNSANNSGNLI